MPYTTSISNAIMAIVGGNWVGGVQNKYNCDPKDVLYTLLTFEFIIMLCIKRGCRGWVFIFGFCVLF